MDFKILIPILGILAAGCTSETPKETTDLSIPSSHHRSISEISMIAKSVPAYFKEATSLTRSSDIEIQDITVIRGTTTRSSSDTLLYAVNFSDDSGYVLIPSNSNSELFIGYVPEGHTRSDYSNNLRFFLVYK